jgi:hypothetical protein
MGLADDGVKASSHEADAEPAAQSFDGHRYGHGQSSSHLALSCRWHALRPAWIHHRDAHVQNRVMDDTSLRQALTLHIGEL